MQPAPISASRTHAASSRPSAADDVSARRSRVELSRLASPHADDIAPPRPRRARRRAAIDHRAQALESAHRRGARGGDHRVARGRRERVGEDDDANGRRGCAQVPAADRRDLAASEAGERGGAAPAGRRPAPQRVPRGPAPRHPPPDDGGVPRLGRGEARGRADRHGSQRAGRGRRRTGSGPPPTISHGRIPSTRS